MSNPATNPDGKAYIWISRWEEFQHYKPNPDLPPAWIKSYTKQLDDDAYRTLTPVQRALLHDLRMAFAKAFGRLPAGQRQNNEGTAAAPRENNGSTTAGLRQLTQRVGYRVTSAQLEALNHAGFIEIVSRETLEQRLDLFYNDSSPRARPRARREVELEKEKEKAFDLDEARPLDPEHEQAPNGHHPVKELMRQVESSLDEIPF